MEGEAVTEVAMARETAVAGPNVNWHHPLLMHPPIEMQSLELISLMDTRNSPWILPKVHQTREFSYKKVVIPLGLL